jgi:methanogenic corrinoid protein MtbC1
MLPVTKTNGKLAVCCALEGDFHELPTHLVQTTLENEGWEVINFGANTPLGALGVEILRHKPNLICISGTIISDGERLANDFQTFSEKIARLKIPVILGGRAFKDKKIRAPFPADFYAQKFADIVRIAETFIN